MDLRSNGSPTADGNRRAKIFLYDLLSGNATCQRNRFHNSGYPMMPFFSDEKVNQQAHNQPAKYRDERYCPMTPLRKPGSESDQT